MRRAAAVFALLAASASARAQDVAPEERAFVEIAASKETCWVGEAIVLRLRVGVDAEFFRDHAVQMFAQKLDVPVRVEAPWIGRPVGASLRDVSPRSGARLSFALDDGTDFGARVDEVRRRGRTFEVVEVARLCLPVAAGDLTIPAPTLRFGHSDRFIDDFVHGRMPVDRRDAIVHGTPLVIHVRALPDAGRPPEFTGAIGKFTARAEIDRGDVAAGETLRLTIRIEGEGRAFAPPRLADMAGFHVYGVIDHDTPPERTLVYDVAPTRDDVTSIPPIAFAYFDPDVGQYRVVKTEAIPLRVRPSPKAADVEPRATDDAGASRWPVVIALVVAALAVVGVLVRRRARRADPRDDGGAHVRDAAAAFRAQPDAEVATSLAAFLAACLRCAPAAVVSPDLAARLVASGATSDVAGRAAALLERLVAARYGGDASADDAAAARAVVDEIESAFAPAG